MSKDYLRKFSEHKISSEQTHSEITYLPIAFQTSKL